MFKDLISSKNILRQMLEDNLHKAGQSLFAGDQTCDICQFTNYDFQSALSQLSAVSHPSCQYCKLKEHAGIESELPIQSRAW